MTESLPEPQPATDGQREPTAQEIADQLIAAVNAVMPKAPDPPTEAPALRLPPPPVEQPGTPAMTPRETQLGKVAVYIGVGTSMPILAGSVFMLATEHANPEVLKWIAVAVGCFGAACAAVGYAVKRIVAAAPPGEVNNTFTGEVHNIRNETNVENTNKWGGKSSTTVIN